MTYSHVSSGIFNDVLVKKYYSDLTLLQTVMEKKCNETLFSFFLEN